MPQTYFLWEQISKKIEITKAPLSQGDLHSITKPENAHIS